MIDEARFRSGDSFAAFLDRPHSNKPLWEAIYKRATVEGELISRMGALGGRWHLLVLSEDWCGDSINILPYLAKLTDGLVNMEMRIMRRDENLDIMDAHLTGKARSIPVVILLDENFRECGWWGPRPTELQSWVMESGLKLPKEERYKQTRTWYARDHGKTTMAEVVGMLEQCVKPRKEGGK